jgi:hypothetical protein
MCAYVSTRPHTSAYVSIRPHTSAYVSIRQQEYRNSSLEFLDSVRQNLPLQRQYLFFCTSKASKLRTLTACARICLLRQYLYFCTSKTSTLVPVKQVIFLSACAIICQLRQNLYSCTSKASDTNLPLRNNKTSKLCTCLQSSIGRAASIFLLLYQ